MLSIPVLVHMRNMRPDCLIIHAVHCICSQKWLSAMGQRKSLFPPPPVLLFSLDLLQSSESSRDKAGLQAAVCEIQATQIAKVKELWCICCWFWGQKPGPLCNLWVTCSVFHHPIGKVAWAAKVWNTSESQAYLWATKSNRTRQQVEAEELLEEIAWAGSHPSHWRKP